MLTVACVLRSGGIYSAEDVAKLRFGVTKHLPLVHRFVCLSDVWVPAEIIPLKHDWPRWWSKIEVFCLEGPVLYLDLDTAIVGDLSDLAKQAGQDEFTALRDFYSEKWIGSGLMAWSGSMKRLYEIFSANSEPIMTKYRSRGDQAFIGEHTNAVRWQDIYPGQVVSYKSHVRTAMNARETGTGEIPDNARVVCLHGRPKFSDMSEDDAVRKVWDAA